jgi:hypothetical protein
MNVAWTDNLIGKDITIVVRDANTDHPDVLAPGVSNAFNVKGTITIPTEGQPVAGNNTPKVVGNAVSMNWSANAASVNTYHLYYVIGGAETYINYNGDSSAILANQLPINFNLLQTMVGTGVSLKVYDSNADHPTTASALSNSMDISGTITLTAQPVPANDTAKNAGDAISIAWSGPSGIVKYDVFYAIDTGSDVAIAACNDIPAATSSCTFSILPAMVGNNVRLKVKDYDPAHPVSASAGSNSMDISGTISITTQPANVDETLVIGGGNRTIEFSDAGLTNFDVVYKIGAGSENAVTGCSNITANSCTFVLASAMVGKSLTVIVKDADTTNHPQVAVPPVSNTFNVKGALTITVQPVAGNNTPKVVNDPISMSWSSNATTVNTYHLYYSIGGAETYINYNGDGTPILSNQLPINFNLLPEMTGIGVSLKVYDANADHPTTITALSNSMNISGTLAVTSLTVDGQAVTTGQTFIVGNTVMVGWNPNGITKFNVVYSIDGGSDQPVNSTPIEGINSHTFTAPAGMIGKNIVLKIKDGDVSHPIVVSSPSNSFDMKGTIVITSQPVANAGTILNVNDPVSLGWAYTGNITSFDVFYSINGGADQKLNTEAYWGTSYGFSVPDAMLGKNVILKVKDANTTGHPDTESSASTLFHVKGSITIGTFTINGQAVTSGQTFASNDPVSIGWNVTGNITDIDVFYKIGTGEDVKINSSPIVAPTTSYNFNALPAMVGRNVILKVKDADLINHALNEASSNVFDMKGILAFTTAPTGVITVDDEAPIAWSKNGNMPEVHLYYTVNGTDTLIASNLAVSSVDWTVPPDAIGASVTLKVKDANLSHPASQMVSAPFGVKGKLAVTQPDGFTAYEINDTPLIEWTKTSTIDSVDLYYSTNGTSWTLLTIAGPVTGTSYNTWNIPGDALGPDVYIKAKDADTNHPLTEAVSASFPVRGKLVMNEPGGNPNTFVEVNGETTITWTRYGTSGPMTGGVTLWYTTNGGLDGYPNEITCEEGARLAADESCTWTIPDNISGNVKVKIILTGDPATTGVSTNSFAIRGKLTVLSPNGDPDGTGPLLAEDWEVQSPQVITWGKDGTTGAMNGNVELKYSVNNGADSYPYLIATALTNGANNGCTPPQGGGCYPWNVSDSVSNLMGVKIILLNDLNVTDVSNNPFRTRAGFTVTSPGAEVWKASQFRTIKWEKRGSVPNAKLEYSTNSFANETQTVEINPSANNGSNTVDNGADGDCTAMAGEGCYIWKVAEAGVSETVMIRVSNANDSVSKDESVEFKIRPIITVVTPNTGNEIWPVGSEQIVSWTTVGNLANVKLEYSTNGFADESQNFPIDTVVNLGATGDCTRPTGGGCYVWTISDAISPPATKNIKVRVSDPSVSSTNDISNENFRIVGGFTVTAPNGTPSAESWPVGSIQTVTWNKAGSVSNVDLYYTKNDTDWTNFASNIVNGSNTANGGCAAPANTGCYKWEMPNDISATAKVRVVDKNDPDGKDESNAIFHIRPDLNLTAPNGGEDWAVGALQTISWKTVGTVTNVKLEYSKLGDFSDAVTIATPLNVGATGSCTIPQGDTGCYLWTVPNAVANNTVKVRVSDADNGHPPAVDPSDNPFTIRAYLEVKAPNGGERWNILMPNMISWTSTNPATNTASTLGTVRIDYSTNASDTTPTWTLVANVSNGSNGGCTVPSGATGCLNWTVPNTPSDDVKILITDTDSGNPASSDDSNSPFAIQGSIIVTSPTSGETWTAGDPHTITWDTTGELNTVKVEYSKLGDFSDAVTINGAAVNDPNRDGQADGGGSIAWNVADAVSSTAKIRVSDPNDSNVKSDLPFNIKAYFEIKTPNGGERWITRQIKDIAWTTINPATGIRSTIGDIKLEYTGVKEGTIVTGLVDGVNNITATYGAEVTCTVPSGATGCYPWEVADLPTIDPDITSQKFMRFAVAEKIKVSDNVAGHPASSDESDATLNVDYWKTRWTLKDLQLGNDLGNLEGLLTFTDPNGNKVGIWSDSGIQSAFMFSVPNGYLNQLGVGNISQRMTWDRPGYFTQVISYNSNGMCFDTNGEPKLLGNGSPNPAYNPPFAGWCSDVDMEYLIYMESTIIHSNISKSSFSYDPETNTFLIDSWLERDGQPFPAVTEGKVDIYDFDPVTANNTLIATLTATCTVYHGDHPHSAEVKAACPKGPDERGVVRQSWVFEDGSGNPLPAKTYKVVTSMTMVGGTTLTNPSQLDTRVLVAPAGGGGGAGGAGTGLASSRFTYDPLNKNFKIDSWLTLDGKVSTAVSQAQITISNADTNVVAVNMPLVSNTVSAGIFRQTWLFKDASNNMLPATTYRVATVVTSNSGKTYEGMDLLDSRMFVAIGGNLGILTLPGGASNLGEQLEAAKEELKGDISGMRGVVDSIKTDTGTLIPDLLGDIQTDVTSILEDTSTTIPEKLTAMDTKMKSEFKAQILNREQTAPINQTLMIRYRTAAGLAPKIDVYDGANILRVGQAVMTPIGATGIYEYALLTNPAWTLGDWTIVCSEATKDTTDSMVLTVRLEHERDIYNKLASLDTFVQTTLSDNVDSILGKWGTLDAATLNTDLDDLLAKLGTPADTSASNTVFGQATFLKEKWGTQTAQALYNQITNAYNKSIEVKSAVQASVGALNVAVMELTDISGQMGPSVESLTGAASNISTQVTSLQAAASEVTASISAMQTAAEQVETAASGITTVVEQSEEDVKAQMDIQTGKLKEEMLSRTTQVTQALESKTQEISEVITSSETAVVGAVAGTSDELRQAIEDIEEEIVTRLGEPSATTSIYADLLSLKSVTSDILAKVGELKSSGGGGFGGAGGSSDAGGASGTGGDGGSGGGGTDDSAKLDSIIASLSTLQGVVDVMDIDLDKVGSNATNAANFAQTASSSASTASSTAENIRTILLSSPFGGKIADQLIGTLLAQIGEVKAEILALESRSAGEGLSAELKAAMSQLVGLRGKDGKNVIPESIAQSQEVQAVQNDVSKMKALLEVINVLVRQQTARPIIKTWFETGG